LDDGFYGVPAGKEFPGDIKGMDDTDRAKLPHAPSIDELKQVILRSFIFRASPINRIWRFFRK